jgi:hypothetical protein
MPPCQSHSATNMLFLSSSHEAMQPIVDHAGSNHCATIVLFTQHMSSMCMHACFFKMCVHACCFAMVVQRYRIAISVVLTISSRSQGGRMAPTAKRSPQPPPQPQAKTMAGPASSDSALAGVTADKKRAAPPSSEERPAKAPTITPPGMAHCRATMLPKMPC